MTSVRRSLAFSFATSYSALAVAVVSSFVLARLLTPAEIGVYSVVAVFVSIAHILRDFGVAQYIIQAPELDTPRIRSAFSLTLALAWCAALALLAASAPLAVFFAEPGVAEVMRVLALNFAIIPFGSITLDLLNRDMRFDTLMRIKVVAAVVHAATSIALALLGFGYMSLAWAAVANVTATAGMAALHRPATLSYLPGVRHLREVLRFGSFASVASLSRAAGEAAPDVVIGRLMGMEAVGLFSRAMGTVRLFTHGVLIGIRPVVLPHLSRAQREGGEPAALYVEHLAALVALGWPFFALLALLAQPVLRTLYGDQWDAAAPLVRLLCAAGAIALLQAFSGDTLVASGRVAQEMRTQILVQGITIAAVVVGALFGLTGAALALVFAALVGHLALALSIYPALGISNLAVHRTLLSGLVMTLITALPAATLLLTEMIPATVASSVEGLQVLALVTPLTLAAWLVGLRVTANPLFAELKGVLRRIRVRGA